MAAVALLHIGDDICHRIPVMAAAGFHVVRAGCSIDDIRKAFSQGAQFSIVTFHNDLVPIIPAAISEVRLHTEAPVVLFDNPSISADERAFDLIIDAQTPPALWLRSLQIEIENSRLIGEVSQRVRAERKDVRAATDELRASVALNRIVAFGSMAMWQRDEEPDE